jgi:hypothetical protein
MFVRFAVGADGENHRWLTGIITEARLLKDRGRLAPHEETTLENAYAWLNTYLPCPPFSTSGWGSDAVSWFKDTAGPSIEKMWDIVALLKEHNVSVRLLKSRHPGKILYEDQFQVVVWEWKRL